jgi:hypothetical protein
MLNSTCLSGSEHSSGTAHVTESSLTSTVSTGTVDTRNTGNSTTSTPRLSRGLVTSLLGDGISLTLVLGHVGVNKVDNIGTDRSLEHSRKSQSGTGAIVGVDVDNRSSSRGL